MGGKTSSESKRKYNAKAYDFIQVSVPKGDRESYKEFAKSKGKSLNAFIVEAIKEKMERET